MLVEPSKGRAKPNELHIACALAETIPSGLGSKRVECWAMYAAEEAARMLKRIMKKGAAAWSEGG